jgi:hypothetical protein
MDRHEISSKDWQIPNFLKHLTATTQIIINRLRIHILAINPSSWEQTAEINANIELKIE